MAAGHSQPPDSAPEASDIPTSSCPLISPLSRFTPHGQLNLTGLIGHISSPSPFCFVFSAFYSELVEVNLHVLPELGKQLRELKNPFGGS